MSKFQYWLGWAAVVASLATVVLGILAITVWHESSIILVKLLWMPFVLAWGVGRIKAYNYAQYIAQVRHDHERNQVA